MKAFGSEYARDPKWSKFKRWYIQLFGVIDLPTRVRSRSVRKAVEHLHCESFLDYGAGTGVYSYFLSRDSQRSGLAMDVDEDRVRAIEKVARSLGRTHLTASWSNESGLTELPSEAFDIILAVEVLMYVNDPVSVLSQFRRCLKSGGTVIAHVPITEYPRPYEVTIFNDKNAVELFMRAGFREPKVHRTFSPNVEYLCSLFSRLMAHPLLLPLVYPLLLFAIAPLPKFVSRGSGRLIIAQNA